MNKKQSFDEYLLEIGNEILKYLIKSGATKEDGEDVIQNTFYKMLILKNEIEPTKIRAWMYRVAINDFFDLKRREKVKQAKMPDLIIQTEFIESPTFNFIESDNLIELISRLKPEYQELLFLKYYFDLSLSEIGEILDMKEATVKTKLYRARNAAKKMSKREEK